MPAMRDLIGIVYLFTVEFPWLSWALAGGAVWLLLRRGKS